MLHKQDATTCKIHRDLKFSNGIPKFDALVIKSLVHQLFVKPMYTSVQIFNLNLIYFNLNLTGFKLNLRYFNLNLRNFNLNLTYFNLNLANFNMNLRYFKLNLTFFNLNLTNFNLCLTYFNLNLKRCRCTPSRLEPLDAWPIPGPADQLDTIQNHRLFLVAVCFQSVRRAQLRRQGSAFWYSEILSHR